MGEAQAAHLGDFTANIRSLHLVNKHGDLINLDKVELGGLPAEVAKQIQVIDPVSFNLLKSIQYPLVQHHMTTAYTLVFIFCALAYLIAWVVMQTLVPKFKKIEL